MKLGTTENFVNRSGDFEETSFRIAASGKAFKILSDNLYSNKIQAIIRELSCNAYDAHVAADNTRTPFLIHLPNARERTFRIRDFGIGLSKEDITNIYTTYFESTKSNSNDFVGCLGLGSKTPFSYTDNFTVVSYFGGKKYTFSAFISETEEPRIALLCEEITDQPNGLEISFAVKEKDFHLFEKEAKNVFKWFKIHPVFEGIVKPVIAPPIPIFKHKNFYLVKGSDVNYHSVVMGNVHYQLEVDNLKHHLSQKLTVLLTGFTSSKFVLEFPIGALNFAPSRERLSYDSLTIKAIERRLTEVEEVIQKDIIDLIDKEDCIWDAIFKLRQAHQYADYIHSALDAGILKKNGVALSNQLTLSHHISIGKYSYKYNWKKKTTNTHHIFDSLSKITPCENLYFVLLDPAQSDDFSSSKFRNWMRAYIDQYKNVSFWVVNDSKDTKEVIEKFGILENKHFFYYHKLPKVPKVRVGGGGYGRKKSEAKSLVIKSSNHLNDSVYWRDHQQVDLKDGTGYYIERDGNKIKWLNCTTSPHCACTALAAYNVVHHADKTNPPIATVWGFTKTQMASVGKGWIPLENVLLKEYESAINDPLIPHEAERYHQYNKTLTSTEVYAQLEFINEILKEAYLLGFNEPTLKQFIEEIFGEMTKGENFRAKNTYIETLYYALLSDPRIPILKNQYLDIVNKASSSSIKKIQKTQQVVQEFNKKYPLVENLYRQSLYDRTKRQELIKELAIYVKAK